MVTSVIVDILDSNMPELTKGTNLFAESGILGKCVFIKTNSYPVGQIVPNVRKAHSRFFIKGYDIVEAIELGEKMVQILTDLKGVFPQTDAQYNIKAVDIISIPSVLSIEDKVVSFNANIFFVRTNK